MNSSTMIHGVATRWASTSRTTNAASTKPGKHERNLERAALDEGLQARGREAPFRTGDSVAKPDLPRRGPRRRPAPGRRCSGRPRRRPERPRRARHRGLPVRPPLSSSAATYRSATRSRPCSRRTYSAAAAPSRRRRSSSSASSSSVAARVATSYSSTGTLATTESGSSENQPASLTTSGLPSESARIAIPEVSPIVGQRRLTQTSESARSCQRSRSSW